MVSEPTAVALYEYVGLCATPLYVTDISDQVTVKVYGDMVTEDVFPLASYKDEHVPVKAAERAYVPASVTKL